METPGARNRQECLFLTEHATASILEHINLSIWERPKLRPVMIFPQQIIM